MWHFGTSTFPLVQKSFIIFRSSFLFDRIVWIKKSENQTVKLLTPNFTVDCFSKKIFQHIFDCHALFMCDRCDSDRVVWVIGLPHTQQTLLIFHNLSLVDGPMQRTHGIRQHVCSRDRSSEKRSHNAISYNQDDANWWCLY